MPLPGYCKQALTDLPTSNVSAGVNYFVVNEGRWYFYNGYQWIKHSETDYQSQITTLQNSTVSLQNSDSSLTASLGNKQNTLISGTNIKTLNGNSLLGSGDLVISGGGTLDLSSKQDNLISGTNIKTINGNSLLGSGNLIISGGNSANIDYTELLLKFNDANNSTDFIDESKNNYLIVPDGNPIISTNKSKFGESSLYLNNSLLKVPLNDFKGDFTIEFWFNLNSIGQHFLISKRASAGAYGAFTIALKDWALSLLATSNNSTWDIAAFRPLTGGLNTNIWYHFALVRQRKNWYSYLDGVKIADFVNGLLIAPNTNNLLIGGEIDGYRCDSYMDNLRISLKAIYTPALYPNGFNLPDENFNVTARLGDLLL